MIENGVWLVEVVPDEDSLFYRVPIADFVGRDFRPHPGVFRENKGSMSCDWEKYSSPAETRRRTGKPEVFGVLRLEAGEIRGIRGLHVEHDPVYPDNRAHSSVLGLGPSKGIDAEARAKLVGLRYELSELFADWEIHPNAPVSA
jgi:hypothetical protein